MTLGPLMVDVAGFELTDEDRRILAHPLVGAVILFTRNFESYPQLEALVREIRAVRSPSLLVTVDRSSLAPGTHAGIRRLQGRLEPRGRLRRGPCGAMRRSHPRGSRRPRT